MTEVVSHQAIRFHFSENKILSDSGAGLTIATRFSVTFRYISLDRLLLFCLLIRFSVVRCLELKNLTAGLNRVVGCHFCSSHRWVFVHWRVFECFVCSVECFVCSVECFVCSGVGHLV